MKKSPETSEKIYCVSCGKESLINYRFCPNCGSVLLRPKAPKAVGPTRRPIAIKIASILCYVRGVVGIIYALLIFASLAILQAVAGDMGSMPLPGLLGISIGVFLMIVASMILIFGVLYLIAGRRLRRGERSGGYLGLALAVMGIIVAIAFSQIMPISPGISIILDLLLLP